MRAFARREASPRTILAVVGFSVFVAADDLTVVATMLRPIIGDLGLGLPDGLDDAAWIVNAYLIAFVAVMPVAGRISDIVGRRRTFIAAYAVFTIGTVVIPLSSSLGPFLVGRVLTAMGGGAMVPVALAVVGDVYPAATRARALGVLGAIETLGWVWGPLYGAVLVRFLSWEWQFWLNIPLAIIGIFATWWALAAHDRPERAPRIDWIGAVLSTITLVSLNLALLGNAEIQSVTGLDELTGGPGRDLRWLWLVAIAGGAAFVWHQRRTPDPLVDPALFRGRNLRLALVANFAVGAALVIAMVDVPLFVNAVEVDVERSAVVAGWVLSALTAAMAVASYGGGRLTERTWSGPPVVVGLLLATAAFVAMGSTWGRDVSYTVVGVQLALLGIGFGLTVAPTSSAVIDGASEDRRGGAAALVMVVRLLGFSVGLSALTAWGLARFDALRKDIDLPPITDPAFQPAVREASERLTSTAIAETFLATAAVTAIGVLAALAMRRPSDVDPDRVGAFDTSDAFDSVEAQAVSTSSPSPTGAPVPSWLHRHLGLVLGAMGLVVVAALVAIVMLFSRLERTEADLARVEAGAALFASQVTGFQNELTELAPNVSAGLDEAIAGLETFGTSTLEFDVSIDEEVQIDTQVVIDRTIRVPITTTLPIKDSFETTIEIDGPFGIDVPLDVTVPVDIDVPIDLELSIPVNETIPVGANVPVKLDVPIRVAVSDTELAELATALAAGLRSFQEVLAGLGSG
jgi:EmrB/QacA subfamily drug resistance transporter